MAGATPGKGGITWQGLIPVFDSVEEARRKTGANTSLVFVPALHASDAIMEAADAGISLVVCITELIPTLDEVMWRRYLERRDVVVIGPN